MISHVSIGITDFERAFAFYQSVMEELGFTLKFSEPEKYWAGWMRPGVPRPLVFISHLQWRARHARKWANGRLARPQPGCR